MAYNKRKKMKNISILIPFVLLFFLCISLNSIAQSNNQSWLSNQNVCLEFDSLTNRLNIGDFYDNYRVGKQRFDYDIENQKLIILWYHNQTMFGYETEKAILNILKFNDEQLNLSFRKDKSRGALIELFGDSIVEFRKINQSCSEYYKPEFDYYLGIHIFRNYDIQGRYLDI